MSFVLDNSVTMRWFFGDGKPQELRFARGVLDAMKNASALVPVTWGLEVANVIARAKGKGLVMEARSAAFLEMLQDLDIEVDTATAPHFTPNRSTLRGLHPRRAVQGHSLAVDFFVSPIYGFSTDHADARTGAAVAGGRCSRARDIMTPGLIYQVRPRGHRHAENHHQPDAGRQRVAGAARACRAGARDGVGPPGDLPVPAAVAGNGGAVVRGAHWIAQQGSGKPVTASNTRSVYAPSGNAGDGVPPGLRYPDRPFQRRDRGNRLPPAEMDLGIGFRHHPRRGVDRFPGTPRSAREAVAGPVSDTSGRRGRCGSRGGVRRQYRWKLPDALQPRRSPSIAV